MFNLVKKFKMEFEGLNENSYYSKFSLLTLLLLEIEKSEFKIDVFQKIKIEFFEKFYLDRKYSLKKNIYDCQYSYFGSFSYNTLIDSNNKVNKLNNELNLYKLIKMLLDSFKLLYNKEYKLKYNPVIKDDWWTSSKLLENEYRSSILIESNICFIINLKIENINNIFNLLFNGFDYYDKLYESFRVKIEVIRNRVGYFNYTTSAVKGYSYYYTLDSHYITKDKNQIIVINKRSIWANDTDTDELYYFNTDILLNIVENKDEKKFEELFTRESLLEIK